MAPSFSLSRRDSPTNNTAHPAGISVSQMNLHEKTVCSNDKPLGPLPSCRSRKLHHIRRRFTADVCVKQTRNGRQLKDYAAAGGPPN